MKQVYLAIDGGGTKTDVLLFDEDGHVLTRAIGASTNPNTLSEIELKNRFEVLFQNIFSEQLSEQCPLLALKKCFAGVAGAAHPKLRAKVERAIKMALPCPCEALDVENDAITALWSGTDGSPGLVLIAGTGSIVYGQNKSGETFRIGGWGHLISDEGSGYSIGKEAARAVLRVYDGLQEPTLLTKAILHHFHLNAVPDLVPILYDQPKTKLASLVPLVTEAAEKGDKISIQIINQALSQLNELIQAGFSRFGRQAVPLVLAGGLWQSLWIKEQFTKTFAYPVIFPEAPPIYGAMLGALGEPRAKEVLEKMKANF